ncbi:hypothetical protein [Geobacillus sp. TFV-3]|uniref:hypothetical protein n=1 Tax=Geobacillus sp. TFV-3 TaxID=1897059 RepID=UPI001F3F7FD4|nr:hypothetical protein [Geobacillus sp. TFV-3]KAF0995883.1 hypothetical protein BJQ97_02545 [Geobacillus sp. TFV-3]
MIKKTMQACCLLLLTGGFLFPSAERTGAEINPTYIPYDGYEYVHNIDTKGLTIYWTHTHVNNKPTADTVSHTVTREAYATANVSASSTFKEMVMEVGISTEVGLGARMQKTTTVTWTIPPYSTYTLRYGSRWVKATGKENYYSRGTLISSKTVSGQWTYEGYSDSIKQK